jgi:hypothetical protein
MVGWYEPRSMISHFSYFLFLVSRRHQACPTLNLCVGTLENHWKGTIYQNVLQPTNHIRSCHSSDDTGYLVVNESHSPIALDSSTLDMSAETSKFFDFPGNPKA